MTPYDELRADLDTVVGLLHELEARMAVRIKEHADMKRALESIARDMPPGSNAHQQFAHHVLESLSKGNP